MTTKVFTSLCLGVAAAAIAIAPASNAALINSAGQAQPINRVESIANFEATHQRSALGLRTDGSIARVYGQAFSTGPTAEISTQRFLEENAAMWGVSTAELIPEGPFADGHHTQPIGYLPDTDSYKFTGYYYKQINQGIPVFRTKLVLLVRNEENNPLVLASSQLHDLSNFQVNNQLVASPVNQGQIVDAAKKVFNSVLVTIDDTSRMIYAGTDSNPHNPVLADITTITVNGIEKYLIATDVATGSVIYQENLIHTIDITGNVSGLASDGPAADFCATEISKPLPYLSVGVQGGASIFADANGDFTIPNAGSNPVTVDATLTGQWFRVFTTSGATTSESVLATPPGPADLFFNAANNSQTIRAQVNAYVEANTVRDTVIAANPAYPQMQQNQFPVNVNQTGGFCPGNAWYDGSSINFCLAGGQFPNTAWSSVLYHEYGHHLVSVAGSGQGQYGEGLGDVISAIILDDSRLGLGFFGNCNSSLRDANNNLQYPQNGEIHDAGRLLAGCAWSTRNELIVTEPATYVDLMQFLAINSILVHTGDLITPQITIDWLTLDDDDADIGNGTPHYNEIAAGFGAHNMNAPPLDLLSISYPAGQPEFVNPNGATIMLVQIMENAGTLDPASPTLMVDTGAGFVAQPMTQLSGTQFEATFPSAICGTGVDYYITSQTISGATQNSPTNAPSAGVFTSIAAFDAPTLVFEDNFQTDTGWTVSGNVAGRATGRWERGTPAGVAQRGAPGTDSDGSGLCFVTGNGGPGSNTDVDDGSTILTSPVMDATGSSIISYSRWYSNNFSTGNPESHTFVVEVSDDAGASWTNLETVGPSGPGVSGGWISKSFTLSDIAGFVSNNQFRVRFTAEDSVALPSVIEAGVDAVSLSSFDCSPCIADINGDGSLNFFDISEFLSLFSTNDLGADFTGDGALNFFDISAFLVAFSAGCP